jgi:hypothetical protein
MSLLKAPAAAAPAGDPPPTTPAAAPPASNPPATTPPAEGERPAHIPEKFWDAEKKAPKVDDVFKAYSELDTWRGNAETKFKEKFEAERLAQRPEKADAYELPKIEDPRVVSDDLKASPLVGWWREQAHSMGLNQEQFQAGINQYMSTVLKDLPDPAAEKKLIGENADQRIGAVQSWAEQTWKDPAEFAAVQQIAETAAGFKVLEKIRASMSGGRPSLADGDPAPTTELTKEDIQKMMASKEYHDARHRDPKVVATVNKWFRDQGGRK